IDKSYVDHIDESPQGARVVRAIIGLAEQFNLFTIAEGVERRSQAERLIELGCYAGQGWLFGRAVPFDEFHTKWLEGPDRIDLRGAATYQPAGDRTPTERR
ncbi:MAG: EAL domain-containing protein, partial [Actinomycetes bacterium]